MTTLNENETYILKLLKMATDEGRGPRRDGWVRPMDIGGEDGSHHSRTLASLFKKGLIETKRRGTLMGCLGSKRAGKLYRSK